MRATMTTDELASLARVPAVYIRDLAAAGLLDPDGDGRFDDHDVLRLQFVTAYTELGFEPHRIAEEVHASGSILARRLFARGSERLTLQEAAQRTGLEPERLDELMTALGLPSTRFDTDDVRAQTVIKGMVDAGMPWELILEGARVYGDVLRRLAEAEVRMTHQHVCGRLAGAGADTPETAAAIYQTLAAIEPVTDEIVRHLHHDYLLRAAVAHAFEHLEGAALQPDGAFFATIVFIDLALFTSLAQVHGDQAAASVLDRFDTVVRRLSVQHGGTLVKQIGDAFMLTFIDPADGVRFGLGVQEASEAERDFPATRVGVHWGPVLYRVGDYVGNTVNVASRVAEMAMPHAILVTEPVAKAAIAAGLDVEPVGVRRTRGSEDPVALHRVVRHVKSGERDPVCGMVVGDDAPARLQRGGVALSFCSEDCLRRYLDDPQRYATAG